MHFVDGEWRVKGVLVCPGFHPFRIIPGMLQVPDDRRGARWNLPVESERITLLHRIPKMGSRFDMILVERAPCRTGDEAFPYPRIVLSPTKRVLARSPLVEVSDDGDLFRVWSPDCEMCSFNSVKLGWMGAKFFV